MVAAPKIFVLDTNALLNDPEVIYAFSGAEVVVPVVVIHELDKIKRQKADRRVRFHGRKATRLLFELSKQGRLVDGVVLPNGSVLRVDETSEFSEAPDDLDLRRPDDRILALACTLDRAPGSHATVVSNDLNLLLRAEVLGLGTYRFEGKLEHLLGRRPTPTEWVREHRVELLLGLLCVLLAVSSGYLYLTRPSLHALTDLPIADDAVMLRNLGVSPEVLEEHYRSRLADDPGDVDAMINLGNLLFDQSRYLEAVESYRGALALDPANPKVRTDLGIALLQLGHVQEAVQAFEQAIRDAPDLALAHYNLGVTLAQDGDETRALQELEEAIRLSGSSGGVPVDSAQALIANLRSRLAGG
jgi:tetratricopeptide (TPR) repeat protein